MSRHSPRHRPPHRRWSTALSALLLLSLAGGLGYAVFWFVSIRKLDWTVRHGAQLLARAATPSDLQGALLRWETETADVWRAHPGRLVRYVMDRHDLADARVRRMLTHATGADFGTREATWRAWARDFVSTKPPRPRFTLRSVWAAPVGLTTWFSSILPLDGNIYVSSHGRAFDLPADNADGVVRVDGKTGQATYLFQPTEAPPRDILGLSATEEGLFAACRNGTIYCVKLDGAVRWKSSVGAQLASTPLTVQVPGVSAPSVTVLTDTGRLVLLHGATGATIWVADVAAPPVATLTPRQREVLPDRLITATLTLANIDDDAEPEILVASVSGHLRAVDLRTGRRRWRAAPLRGASGGAIAGVSGAAGQELLVVADLDGRVLTSVNSGQHLDLAAYWELHSRYPGGVVAAPRTLQEGTGPVALVVCTAGTRAEGGASVALLDASGVRWRRPVEGVIWAAPAIADVAGGKEPEIVVVSSTDHTAGGGLLTVLSSTGLLLRQDRLPYGLETPPSVADVDGDGKLELLIADRQGMLHCLATSRDRAGAVEWGLLGGDSRNARRADHAYEFGQLPHGFQARWRPK